MRLLTNLVFSFLIISSLGQASQAAETSANHDAINLNYYARGTNAQLIGLRIQYYGKASAYCGISIAFGVSTLGKSILGMIFPVFETRSENLQSTKREFNAEYQACAAFIHEIDLLEKVMVKRGLVIDSSTLVK